MAQRFGRVNRYGTGNARIDIVHPKTFDTKDKPFEAARERTLFNLLKKLREVTADVHDASPTSLSELLERVISEGCAGSNDSSERAKALREYILSAFAPPPTILPATDILFDAWALTSIKDPLPGRPTVEPYLHGVTDDDYGTEFAWREEVELISDKADIAELLDEYPLKPHETLRVPTFAKKGSAKTNLAEIAEREPNRSVWVIASSGVIEVSATLAELVKLVADEKVSLAERVVILPPKAGGLTANGMLKGDEKYDAERHYDVAGIPPKGIPLRRLKLVRKDGELAFEAVARTEGWAQDLKVRLEPDSNRWKVLEKALTYPVKPSLRFVLDASSDEDDETDGAMEYLIIRPAITPAGTVLPAEWPALSQHNDGVRGAAEGIVNRLKLEPSLAEAVILAAYWHDLGKGRAIWQRGAGNSKEFVQVAKTLHGRAPENLNSYRHELGSMVDAISHRDYFSAFDALKQDQQRELVLHLIATHHGRGRPHFPINEAFDVERPDALVAAVVSEVPGRFARLQRRYGRWGLAYLESLLRAADALESRRIAAAPLPDNWPKAEPTQRPTLRPLIVRPNPKPSITVAVDPTNPGQFFACCGLLELADRLWPGAEGWFAEDGREFHTACEGTLKEVLNALVDCELTNTMTREQNARLRDLSDKANSARKAKGAEEEKKALEKMKRENPIVLLLKHKLEIDWFLDNFAGGSRFKTWAGQQSVLDISISMKAALNGTAWRNEKCLAFSVTGAGLPFNFDADLGGQGGAIDVGFSFDSLAGSAVTRIQPSARPALELLAFIGLQRFRPVEIKGQNRFLYTVWNRPLPIQVAQPEACGALPQMGSLFEFRLLYRTKYLKSFLPAIPFSGGSDE